MRYHYVWLLWSCAFLALWGVLFVAIRRQRRAMWRASLVTALFGLTEPIFVPTYWLPPSLFELAQRTGFDIESFIFAFAVGGIGVVWYTAFARRELVPYGTEDRRERRHRLHRVALVAPFALLVPAYLLPWNPIYPSLLALALGALGSVACRPDLMKNTLVGGVLFFLLYGAFMLGLRWFTPAYIEAVWNLPALSGGLICGIPVEELLFGLTFGMYWSGVYEHLTWHRSVSAAHGQPSGLDGKANAQ